jgi:hypothetical protein
LFNKKVWWVFKKKIYQYQRYKLFAGLGFY